MYDVRVKCNTFTQTLAENEALRQELGEKAKKKYSIYFNMLFVDLTHILA